MDLQRLFHAFEEIFKAKFAFGVEFDQRIDDLDGLHGLIASQYYLL